jgi:ribonuclease VapC
VIIDSSAIVAILRREPGYEQITETLAKHSVRRMSAATYLELSIVIGRFREPDLFVRLVTFLQEIRVEVVPFTPEQAEIGSFAATLYGKGSGHPAQLNFGDCFSYALAKESGEPLLFKGNDFAHTDLILAGIN